MQLKKPCFGRTTSELLHFAIIDAPYDGHRAPTLFVFGRDKEVFYRWGHKFDTQQDAFRAAQAIEDAVCALDEHGQASAKRHGPSHELQNQAVKEFTK